MQSNISDTDKRILELEKEKLEIAKKKIQLANYYKIDSLRIRYSIPRYVTDTAVLKIEEGYIKLPKHLAEAYQTHITHCPNCSETPLVNWLIERLVEVEKFIKS